MKRSYNTSYFYFFAISLLTRQNCRKSHFSKVEEKTAKKDETKRVGKKAHNLANMSINKPHMPGTIFNGIRMAVVYEEEVVFFICGR